MLHNIKSTLKNNRWLYWLLRGIRFDSEDSGYQARLFEQHELIKERVRAHPPTTVLEIGCGFGRNIKFLIEDCGVAPEAITGIDFSKTMLLKARKFLRPYYSRLTLKAGSALDLPFADGQFDLVLIHGVFMHIDPENLGRAAKEAVRVCSRKILQVEEFDEARMNSKSNEYTFIHDYRTAYPLSAGRPIKVSRLATNPKLLFFEVDKAIGH